MQVQDRKIRTIFEIIRRPKEMKLLSPEKPFSNKKAIRDIICACEKYIYWIDKYFSRAGLDWLSESMDFARVKDVRVLMSPEKMDKKFMSLYYDFKEELRRSGVTCEFRVITSKRLNADIHDRWIISRNLCYNTPSTDTIARGQYSELKRTTNFPPFKEWWDKSQDILAK